jgi:hypothetical protein
MKLTAPTTSSHSIKVEFTAAVCSQLHNVAILPLWKEPLVPFGQKAGWASELTDLNAMDKRNFLGPLRE